MSDTPFNAMPSLVDVEPEDFDFDAFVAGATGSARMVSIISNLRPLKDFDRLKLRSNDPDLGEGEAVWILEEMGRVRDTIRDSRRDFVVEGRSPARASAARASAGKAPKPGDDAEKHIRYAYWARLHELADAITTPSGVTAESLAQLGEMAPGEIDKLWSAYEAACQSRGPALDF